MKISAGLLKKRGWRINQFSDDLWYPPSSNLFPTIHLYDIFGNNLYNYVFLKSDRSIEDLLKVPRQIKLHS